MSKIIAKFHFHSICPVLVTFGVLPSHACYTAIPNDILINKTECSFSIQHSNLHISGN